MCIIYPLPKLRSVEKNRRFDHLVSQHFLFIYVGQYIVVNVEITT